MAQTSRPLTPAARAAAVALPFLFGALLPLIYDVVREIPETYNCSVSEPVGHAAIVSAYEGGANLLHLGVIGCALAALLLLSAGGGPAGVGWPTLVAAQIAVLSAVLALYTQTSVVAWVLLPLALFALSLAELAGPLGPQATGALAALLLVGVGVQACRATLGGRMAWARAALWVLVVLTGTHLLLVYVQGVPPIC